MPDTKISEFPADVSLTGTEVFPMVDGVTNKKVAHSTIIAGLETTSGAQTKVDTHAAAGDPHPGYLTAAEGTAAYDAIGAATSAVSTHAGLSDPHAGYRLESVPISAADVAADIATQAELDAKVTDAIADGVTTVAPSQNAVFDALALKAATASLGTAATADKVAAGVTGVLDATDATTTNTRTPTDATVTPAKFAASAIDPSAATAGARTLGTGAAQATAGNDSRLSDARTPTTHKTSHEPGGSDAMTVDAAAGVGSLRTLGTSSTTAAAGNDGRFTDTRTPTAATVTPPKMALTVALTDGTNIATDASLAEIFSVTIAGNRTIDNPTNPTAGQTLIYRIKQDGTGSRTITWGSEFRFGTDVPSPTLSTTAAKTDYIGFRRNTTDTKWDCLAVARGY